MAEPLTILIVEDSAIQREMLRRMLTLAEYHPMVAKHGADGLAAARQHLPHLIISDIAMPEMDGYQLCLEIKRDPALRHIPVMLLTELADAREIIRGLEAGADNYLTKPYDEKDLLNRIRSLLINTAPQVSGEGDGEEDGTREDDLKQDSMSFSFDGERHEINTNRRQILNLLLSTYENAVRKNRELLRTQLELRLLNDKLEEKVRERTRQLEIANHTKSQFVANLSHELRTPMNAIIGMTEVTLQSNLDPEQRRLLEIARHSANSLLGMINRLLDFARLESGVMAIQDESFYLREFLARLCLPSAKLANGKGLGLTCRVGAGIPDHLQGDRVRLWEILTQLLDNAVKFTDQGGVSLILTPTAPANTPILSGQPLPICFEVVDTGIGIGSDQTDMIFEAFTQGDGSSTRKYGGTGIGLSLAKRFAELMDGQIRFLSKPGQGSRFFLETSLKIAMDNNGATTDWPPMELDFPSPLPMQATEAPLSADPESLGRPKLLEESARCLQIIHTALTSQQPAQEWDHTLQWLKKAADLLNLGGMRDDLLRLAMAARRDDRQKALEYWQKIGQYLS